MFKLNDSCIINFNTELDVYGKPINYISIQINCRFVIKNDSFITDDGIEKIANSLIYIDYNDLLARHPEIEYILEKNINSISILKDKNDQSNNSIGQYSIFNDLNNDKKLLKLWLL